MLISLVYDAAKGARKKMFFLYRKEIVFGVGVRISSCEVANINTHYVLIERKDLNSHTLTNGPAACSFKNGICAKINIIFPRPFVLSYHISGSWIW
jgi:hypothetical protein